MKTDLAKPKETPMEQANEETGLLPCPFCGGKAKMNRVIIDIHVSCSSVTCCISNVWMKPMLWNKRAPLISSRKTESVES